MGIKRIVKDGLTIAEKELKLEMRFKVYFFTSSFIGPLLRLIPFILVYYGFFVFSNSSRLAGGISSKNFAVFLLMGTLVDIFFTTGYISFGTKFMREKFWQTIDGLLIAPINKFSLILGVGICEFVILLPATLFFIAIAVMLMPVGIIRIAIVMFILLLVLLISLSMGLIAGCADLFNENLKPFFDYFRLAVVFFSCFYYPIQFLPKSFWFLTTINPLFHAASIARNVWFYGTIPKLAWLKHIFPVEPMAYLLVFAVVSPIVGIFVFRKLWRWLGIQGY
jgi:ABC-2 type transport system permease protein